jgi:hypothetical protein
MSGRRADRQPEAGQAAGLKPRARILCRLIIRALIMLTGPEFVAKPLLASGMQSSDIDLTS